MRQLSNFAELPATADGPRNTLALPQLTWHRLPACVCAERLRHRLEAYATVPAASILAARRIIAMVLILLFVNRPSIAQETSPALKISEVRPLLNQLGADSRAQRIAAQRQLLTLGSGAVPFVLEAEETAPNSMQWALREVRENLIQQSVQHAGQPTILKLIPGEPGQVGQVTLKQLVDSLPLSNRLEIQTLDPRILEKQLELPAGPLTFWQVVGHVERSLDLRVRDNGLAMEFVSDANRKPVSKSACDERSSALRVSGTYVVRSDDKVSLSLSVLAEPRLRALFLTCQEGQVIAQGRELPLRHRASDSRVEIPFFDKVATATIDFRTKADAINAGKPLPVRGSLVARVCPLWTPIAFDLNKSTENREPVRRGGVTVGLVTATPPKGEQGWTVTLQTQAAHGGPEYESHRAVMVREQGWLECSRGGTETLRLAPKQIDSEILTDRGGQIRFRFPPTSTEKDGMTADRFVYAAPLLFCDVAFEFTFEATRELPRD